ncbi:hypothetical protein HJ588_17445 [Flexivirga sp. ID2601S]|uniref:FUSC family protein n=1 Tax=Flexivirga aerilata TaxID=1656889 RepID=A0A849ANG4_9MICO|nr:hypothetical protein [Flexivirga aerilata]NNG41046.1 hypothetical protein [Flexivirga aerilata]
MSESTDVRAAKVARVGRIAHHRLVGMSLKTALAAGIAWQLGMILPAYLPQYAFYAPLGALTVMYSSLYDSAVEGLRVLAAVATGVLVSLTLQLVAGPNALSVAVALGVGVLLGNLRKLADQGSWVPLAALFVFTAGQTHTTEYVVGYMSQLLLGAGVGLVVNSVVFPPLALHETERAGRAVRRDIVRVLSALSGLLEADHATADERADDLSSAAASLPESRQRLRTAMSQARRAGHGNPRRQRWQGSRSEVLALAGATERCAGMTEDLARETLEEVPALRRAMVPTLAQAVTSLRDLIVRSPAGVPSDAEVRRTDEAIDRAASRARSFPEQRTVAGLRRCLRAASDRTM